MAEQFASNVEQFEPGFVGWLAPEAAEQAPQKSRALGGEIAVNNGTGALRRDRMHRPVPGFARQRRAPRGGGEGVAIGEASGAGELR